MRNFLLFIRRFFNLILFLALEVICAVLIARTNTMQGNDIVNSSNTVTGFFYKQQDAVTYYFRLKTMNDSLLRENARLHSSLAANKYSVDTLKESIVSRPISSGDSQHIVQYARYIYRTARVINNSVANDNNYFTINIGSNNGVKPGMAVISGSGVAGKVAHTSPHFATVLSVLSDIQPVSSKLKDGTSGLTRWVFERRQRKPDVLYMPDVPREIPMRLGDSVYTTSYSFFPPDVLVGTIARVDIVKKTGKRLLTLKPATSFRNMQYVYVVENTMAAEQTALEAQNTQKQKEGGKR